MRIGFWARVDNGGLGVESIEIIEHLKPDKVMKIMIGGHKQYPDRFPDAIPQYGVPSDDTIKDFIKDINLLIVGETPYNPSTFSICRKAGVKTVLMLNYEYLGVYIGYNAPDLFLAPIDWNMENIPNPKMMLPFPIATEKIAFRQRKTARRFLHLAGHGGTMDRNGTNLVRAAMSIIKSNAEIVIKEQDDKKAYTELYDDYDVLLYPRRHSGLSLPVNEAMASGMVICMSDMKPQNQFLLKEYLIPVKRISGINIQRYIEFGEIDPVDIAAKVDSLFNTNTWRTSLQSREIAEKMSWQKLLPAYQRTFNSL